MSTEEEWRPVVGYEGKYEVSDLGRVRRAGSDRVRKPRISVRGYTQTNLRKDGVQRTHAIHRLVGEAFLGPRPVGLETRHLNGIATDNRVVNIAYGTRSENVRDMVRHGTHNAARRTHCSSGHALTPENVTVEQGCRRCKTCRRARRRGVSAAA